MSSANKRCEINGPPRHTGKIFQCRSRTDKEMRADKLSKNKTNKYGESGSPCRIPRLGMKLAVRSPFQRTAREVVDMQVDMS